MATKLDLPQGMEFTAEVADEHLKVLTTDALELIAELHRKFESERQARLAARKEVQKFLDEGGELDFLEETAHIREDAEWQVAAPAPGLEDRRVEVTGPTYRKMTINALNSGAKAWLADQEDANTPAWESVLGGQVNLLDAINREIDFVAEETGKEYKLRPDEELPTIIVRPRGWHMTEKHILVDGEPVSGSLVDFALYFATAGRRQIEKGLGPYFYLPKMESYLEARLWNDVFVYAQNKLGVEQGTIRATRNPGRRATTDSGGDLGVYPRHRRDEVALGQPAGGQHPDRPGRARGPGGSGRCWARPAHPRPRCCPADCA